MSDRGSKAPITGGILTLISGALGVLGAASYSIGFGEPGSGFGRGDMPPFVPSIIYGVPAISVAVSALAIAGGIFAIRRNRWSWALAGSIGAALSFVLLGIPALVLIAMSRQEFS